MKEGSTADEYLECEKWWVFAILMFVGGYFGAFTYSIRGGIFCNAQTANFVLFAMALGGGEWRHAAYYLIPISAYFMGAFISESVPPYFQKLKLIRWDTLLVIIEMFVVIFLGMLPETAPYQITQVCINFICSMQYNTFRQAQGVPMATTFCTNHIRQVGISLSQALQHPGENQKYYRRAFEHFRMISVFVLGGVCSAALCNRFLGRAIWGSLIPLGIVLADLLYADIKKEKAKLGFLPHGH
jgi:uncharacterized membrane protein YoaK (UPF0700 family)